MNDFLIAEIERLKVLQAEYVAEHCKPSIIQMFRIKKYVETGRTYRDASFKFILVLVDQYKIEYMEDLAETLNKLEIWIYNNYGALSWNHKFVLRILKKMKKQGKLNGYQLLEKEFKIKKI